MDEDESARRYILINKHEKHTRNTCEEQEAEAKIEYLDNAITSCKNHMSDEYGNPFYVDGVNGEVYVENPFVYLYSCEVGVAATWFTVQVCCLRKSTQCFYAAI